MQLRKINPHSERGAVLAMSAVGILFLLLIAGFVIDLSRFEAAIRRAQNAADQAALAAVSRLETRPIFHPVLGSGFSDEFSLSKYSAQQEVNDFAAVKKSTLLSLSTGDLLGLNAEAAESLCTGGGCSNAMRFKKASGTLMDCPDYSLTMAEQGNLEVRVERGIYCYWQDPALDPLTAPIRRVWLSVEGDEDHYCKANAVNIELTLRNQPTSFMSLVGFNTTGDFTVKARAFKQEPIPNIAQGETHPARDAAGGQPLCASVSCDSLGIRPLLVNANLLDPTMRLEIGTIRCNAPSGYPDNC